MSRRRLMKNPPCQKAAAYIAHWAFNALLLALAVSGTLAWFGGIEQAAQDDNLFKVALLGLIALHIAATLVHQFILHTNVPSRMRTLQI